MSTWVAAAGIATLLLLAGLIGALNYYEDDDDNPRATIDHHHGTTEHWQNFPNTDIRIPRLLFHCAAQ